MKACPWLVSLSVESILTSRNILVVTLCNISKYLKAYLTPPWKYFGNQAQLSCFLTISCNWNWWKNVNKENRIEPNSIQWNSTYIICQFLCNQLNCEYYKQINGGILLNFHCNSIFYFRVLIVLKFDAHFFTGGSSHSENFVCCRW